MKHIEKHGALREYNTWRDSVRGKTNEDFRCLLNPLKERFHMALIKEQGGLCPYTMKRIDYKSSHLEHIKPETLCRIDSVGSDLDYYNLIACFPREGMPAKCRYGAQAKDNWWVNNGLQFVSPIHPRCESLFVFNKFGEISAYQNNTDAKITIDVLKLDNKTLTEDRRRAISIYINGRNGDAPLPIKIAETAIKDIIKHNGNGELFEFCIALKHALVEYIAYLEKISLKKKYIRQQKQKG